MDATMERSGFKPTQPTRPKAVRAVLLATWVRSFEECLAAVRDIRLEGSFPLFLRLASQAYPTSEQQAALVEFGLPLVSVPDRFAERGTSRHEREALLNRAVAQFMEARPSFDEPVSLPPTVEKRQTDGRDLTDEERRQWLQALAAEDFVFTP